MLRCFRVSIMLWRSLTTGANATSSGIVGLGLLLLSANLMAAQEIKSGELKLSVVELYTSEGCSSCPPADEFLSKLGNTQEAAQIVPLAFHVDYWDYIGWEDPYAQAAFTARQRTVARRNQQSSIYTPEFVVDGAEARGSRNITDKLKVGYNSLAEADISLTISDIEAGQLRARARIDALRYQGGEQAQVVFVVYENGLSSRIEAGENRGRTLTHNYVVRYLAEAEQTGAGKQHTLSVPLDPDWDVANLGLSVVVKLRESGRTLQAVKAAL